MKRLALIAAALTCISAPVSYPGPVRAEGQAPGQAPPAPSLTVRDALPLALALRNLDGHQVVTKQNGADALVMIPWDFENGSLRLRIAQDLTALKSAETGAEDARLGIIRELLKKSGGTNIQPGTPDYDEFLKQYAQVLDAPTGIALQRIKASELKLDKNEIPVTVLSALAPILDIDK